MGKMQSQGSGSSSSERQGGLPTLEASGKADSAKTTALHTEDFRGSGHSVASATRRQNRCSQKWLRVLDTLL